MTWSQEVLQTITVDKDSAVIGDVFKMKYTIIANDPTIVKGVNFAIFDSLKSQSDLINYDSLDHYTDLDWNGYFDRLPSKSIDIKQSEFIKKNNGFFYSKEFDLTFWNIGVYQLPQPKLILSQDSLSDKVASLEGPYLMVKLPDGITNKDTTQAILPIKNILVEKKNYTDYLWILYLLLAILISFLAYWYWKKRQVQEEIIIPDPVILPAHYIAQAQLNELTKLALWKSGKIKEHQSKLTFTIRQYLENRFGINALESTTDQIVRSLKKQNFSSKHQTELIEILQIADMVKFAKAEPPIDINESFLLKAKEFVNQTQKTLSSEEEEVLTQAQKEYDLAMSKLNKKNWFLLALPFSNFEFQHPWLLLLFLLLPLMWFLRYRRNQGAQTKVKFPHVGSISNLKSFKSVLVKYLPLLRYLGLALLILAIARPRLVLKEEEVKAEGIDIMLVMDLSSSMLARDFNPDRLTVSKEMAKKFIDKRPYDRIGLVVFAGESFTQSPLTTDHRIVKEFLNSIESGMLDDGTAIGMGLASAVNRLKTSDSKSKTVILLTDGVNNAGYIKPMTAAEIAKEIDVKVYTIGVGSMGEAISPVSRRSDGRYIFGVSRVEIDEELLAEISKLTGGQYFRATNEVGLEQIYAEIDRLEKTEIEVSVFKRYSEEFRKFLVFGLFFIALEWLLKSTILRTLP